MKTALETCINIRVCSISEDLSMVFSIRLLPHLESARQRKVRPLIITSMKSLSNISAEFSDIRKWSFTNALMKTKDFLEKGINTIILSDDFCDWDTEKEVINDELYEWKDYLSAQSVDIVTIETYGEQERQDKFEMHFQTVNNWRSLSFQELVEFMICHSSEASLLAPVGCDPYFFIDPSLTADRFGGSGTKILVGVQTWIFPKFVERFGAFDYPFQQIGSNINCPNYDAGPMPVILQNVTSLDVVAREIRETYDQIWNDWFKGYQCTQAELRIVVNPFDASEFSPSENVIYIPLCDGDVEHYESSISCKEFAEDEKWRIWKQALIHEMLHEYEHKILKEPTADGIRIRNRHKMIFDPKEKHGELFYSAIADKASYFGMEQEEFRDRL